jgi:hypothetical protein
MDWNDTHRIRNSFVSNAFWSTFISRALCAAELDVVMKARASSIASWGRVTEWRERRSAPKRPSRGQVGQRERATHSC